MSTRDLINAIAAGDAIEIENAFNSVLAEKVSARIDDMRIDVAQNLFAEQQTEELEEVELNLEDCSLEEIEEFIMSEDFEQLDEISKNTAISYLKKANKDLDTRTGEGETFTRKTNNRETGLSRATKTINKAGGLTIVDRLKHGLKKGSFVGVKG